MSQSDRDGCYGISRALEAADREIRSVRNVAGNGGPGTQPGRFRKADAGNGGCRAAWSTHAKLLLGDGISLPAPDRLVGAEEVAAKLWEVIDALASRRVFIHHTNHLTNRELYAVLWAVHLNETTRSFPISPGSASHINLLESATGSENHASYFREPVSSSERSFRETGDSNRAVPNSVNSPYDRDRYLPRQEPW